MSGSAARRLVSRALSSAAGPRPKTGVAEYPAAVSRVADDFVVERGVGSWIHTKDGRKLLDLTTGIGVTVLGHCHPKVVKAIQDQAGKLLHGQLNCVTHQPALDLYHGLSKVTGLDAFTFANSGSEAVELSVRLARHATGRTNVVVFQGGFHGRTLGAGSFTTAKTVYRAGYQPTMSGVFVAPYCYPYRCPKAAGGKCCGGSGSGSCCGFAVEQLDLLFKQQTAPEETAAMLVEPVLGEGGYVVPCQGFLQALRKKADETGALLILDEVQSGFGRTGTMFAFEQFGVRPDLLVMAKGIATGLPLSCVGTRKAIMDKARPGSLGGTYGGNVVACAAANAVLRVFEEEKILDNVRARGKQMRAGLDAIQAKYGTGIVGDVRGMGLMLAIEFGPEVPAKFSGAVAKACYEKEEMLILTAGVYESMRLIPPLTINADEVDQAVSRLDRAIGHALAAAKK